MYVTVPLSAPQDACQPPVGGLDRYWVSPRMISSIMLRTKSLAHRVCMITLTSAALINVTDRWLSPSCLPSDSSLQILSLNQQSANKAPLSKHEKRIGELHMPGSIPQGRWTARHSPRGLFGLAPGLPWRRIGYMHTGSIDWLTQALSKSSLHSCKA